MSVRLNYLDSSRGIAAFIVFFSHLQLVSFFSFKDAWPMKTPLKLFFDGDAAVLYFFILSGYVLSKSFRNEESLNGKVYFRFIARRFFRIYPAFLVTLILSYIITASVHPSEATWLNRYWQNSTGIFDLIRQALLVIRIPNEPELRLLPHDWTLSIEFALSFLLPMLALTSKKNPFVVLIVIYTSVKFLKIDSFVFDFSVGIFIAQAERRFISIFQNKKQLPVLLVLALLLICSDYIFPDAMNVSDRLLIHHKSWGLAILLLILLSNKVVQSGLSIKPLVFLGRISYSFYLVHLIIIYAILAITGINFWLLFPACFIIAIILSSFLYRFVEKPFNSYGKNFIEKMM